MSLLVDKVGVNRGEVLKDFPKMSMDLPGLVTCGDYTLVVTGTGDNITAARHYWGNEALHYRFTKFLSLARAVVKHCYLFLFLRLLRCFSSPGSRLTDLCVQSADIPPSAG